MSSTSESPTIHNDNKLSTAISSPLQPPKPSQILTIKDDAVFQFLKRECETQAETVKDYLLALINLLDSASQQKLPQQKKRAQQQLLRRNVEELVTKAAVTIQQGGKLLEEDRFGKIFGVSNFKKWLAAGEGHYLLQTSVSNLEHSIFSWSDAQVYYLVLVLNLVANPPKQQPLDATKKRQLVRYHNILQDTNVSILTDIISNINDDDQKKKEHDHFYLVLNVLVLFHESVKQLVDTVVTVYVRRIQKQQESNETRWKRGLLSRLQSLIPSFSWTENDFHGWIKPALINLDETANRAANFFAPISATSLSPKTKESPLRSMWERFAQLYKERIQKKGAENINFEVSSLKSSSTTPHESSVSFRTLTPNYQIALLSDAFSDFDMQNDDTWKNAYLVYSYDPTSSQPNSQPNSQQRQKADKVVTQWKQNKAFKNFLESLKSAQTKKALCARRKTRRFSFPSLFLKGKKTQTSSTGSFSDATHVSPSFRNQCYDQKFNQLLSPTTQANAFPLNAEEAEVILNVLQVLMAIRCYVATDYVSFFGSLVDFSWLPTEEKNDETPSKLQRWRESFPTFFKSLSPTVATITKKVLNSFKKENKDPNVTNRRIVTPVFYGLQYIITSYTSKGVAKVQNKNNTPDLLLDYFRVIAQRRQNIKNNIKTRQPFPSPGQHLATEIASILQKNVPVLYYYSFSGTPFDNTPTTTIIRYFLLFGIVHVVETTKTTNQTQPSSSSYFTDLKEKLVEHIGTILFSESDDAPFRKKNAIEQVNLLISALQQTNLLNLSSSPERLPSQQQKKFGSTLFIWEQQDALLKEVRNTLNTLLSSSSALQKTPAQVQQQKNNNNNDSEGRAEQPQSNNANLQSKTTASSQKQGQQLNNAAAQVGRNQTKNDQQQKRVSTIRGSTESGNSSSRTGPTTPVDQKPVHKKPVDKSPSWWRLFGS